jgi:adiponectin receptor
LEKSYNDVLITKETLEAKIAAGIRLMEDMLSDFEHRAYTVREQGFGGMAGELMDEGRRTVNEGLERAELAVTHGMERARRAKETVKESISVALAAARERGLIHYHELPDPWRVNPHIIKGYRFSENKLDCVRSACCGFSNETVNIWSHFLGLLLVLSIAFYFYPTSVNFYASTKADTFIAGVFFFAACKCLVCSTLWHTMNSVADQTLMERFACVDYTGISLLIAASIMTTEYTAFYCEPLSRSIYLATTAVLGIGGVILPWHPTFNRLDMAWARVAFYVTLGATGFLPIVQLSLTRGVDWTLYFYGPITKSIVVYLIGALVYASRVPERWAPGFFDYVGGSHNLWHFAVLGGILFHYFAMQEFFKGAFLRAATECSVY